MRRAVTVVVAAAVSVAAAPAALADDGLLSTVTSPATSTVSTVTAPLTQTVSQTVTPVTQTVTEAVTETVTRTPATAPLAPPVETVDNVVAPVVETASTAVEPLTTSVDDAVATVPTPLVETGGALVVRPARRTVTATEPASPLRGRVARDAAAAIPGDELRVRTSSIVPRRSPSAQRPEPVSVAAASPGRRAALAADRPRPGDAGEPAARGLFDALPLPTGVWRASGPLSDGLILVLALLVAALSLAVPPFARRLLPVG